jgi:hypothetical protein
MNMMESVFEEFFHAGRPASPFLDLLDKDEFPQMVHIAQTMGLGNALVVEVGSPAVMNGPAAPPDADN